MRPLIHRPLLRSGTARLVRVGSRAATLVALLVAAACSGGGDVTGSTGGNNGGNNGGGTQNNVPSRIDLSSSAIGLGAVGASENITATVRDAAGNMLPTASVSWSSADITIADVSGSGSTATITARAPGSTTVRATSGSVTQSISVNVSIVRAITLPASSQVRTGGSIILTPTLDADAGAATALRWESSDPTIATVSSGVVTGVQPGNTNIRVSAVGDPRISAVTQLTVTTARSVVIRNAPSELFLGDERQLETIVDVNDGESRAVEWSTSNPTVASVTSSGRVISVGLGTTVIRVQSAAFTGMKDSAVIAVRVPRIVTVSPATTTVGPGQTRQLSASVQIEEGMSTAVTWRSANASVAMVSSNGLVTGVAQGTTTITAVLVADTTRRGEATVTIAAMVRDVEVQPAAASVAVGETRQLIANVTGDAGASTDVLWRSANAAVATVDATGNVTGVTPGATVITAVSVGDTTRQSTSLITVRSAPVVAVTPESLALEPGEVGYLGVTVQAEPGVNTGVTWSTSDASVATVSSAGQVNAIANGSAIITAVSVADTTRRSSSTITVSTQPGVRAVSVSPAVSSLQAGQTVQLVPAVQVAGGASAAVSYRSSNPAVASVNFAGLVTALGNGLATITVTATADPSKTATATVTITATPTQLATSWSSSRLAGALHEDVVSFDAIDASTAFAVNSKGDVFVESGGTWSLGTRGSAHGTQFLAVSATGGSNAIAVGTNGVIVRFDGSSWTRQSSSTQQTLNGVHLENASAGFAVGASGLVLRYDGSSWTGMNTGSSQTLYGVWTSGSNGYAVGSNGEILRWNGSTWSRQSSPTSETLYGVHALSTSSAAAVGAFGTVLRFNGSNWLRVNSGSLTADLHDVQGTVSNSRYYIAGDDGMYSLTNNSLATVSTPYAPRLFSVSVDGAQSVYTSGQRGLVMRFTGDGWNTENLAPDLIDVWTTAANNAWAVGEFGFVYRWNGSSWARQSTPTTATLNTVWANSATDAFVGGDDGTMLRWNGSSWSSMSFPSSGNVYGVWGTASNNVYAVTSSGEVVRYNGSSWSVMATTSNALWSVYGAAANDVYVAGENGAAMRFNGTTWSNVNAPTTGTLAGAWASSPANVLFVGSGSNLLTGVAFRYTGSNWSSVTMPTTTVLTSVWGTGANDVYTTGAAGTMLRWNGSAWSSMSTGTTDWLWAVSGAPSGVGGGFAVGYNSTVVAATSSSGMVVSGLRALSTARGMELDPRAGAKAVRGALPSGKARQQRR